ncbi:MAG: glycosyltransferase [Bacteroidales bacterium]|nr:glycosyltransferase [Bacteroidales bacterium]
MTKIVLVTPILQHYRLTFYDKLSKTPGYDLTVFYGYKKREDGRPSYEGETSFKSIGFREYKYRVLPFDIVYDWGMYTQIKKINPDVVIVQGIAGDLSLRRILSWAKRKKKKIIIWACAWEPGRAKGLLMKLKYKFVSTFFHKADYFLTYSTHASNYCMNLGIDKSRIETCYNGIEIEEMQKNQEKIVAAALDVRKKLELDNYITFLYVGGLILEKRVDLLVDAFARLRQKYKNIKLLIIGDGPLRPQLEEQLKKYNDENIKYLGRIVSEADIYFAAADCFVLPGIGGLALNQAMFWKKTCIVSEADGTEDDLVIENHSGYRFKRHDLDSLVSAMERRINEAPEKLSEMEDNSRRIITEKSNVNNMVSHFVNGINKLIQ